MSETKTQPTDQSVDDFIGAVAHNRRREDGLTLLDMMKRVTGEPPVLWGDSIIGFGQYHYKYASGREGDWLITGFSPRKTTLSLYIMSGFSDYEALLGQLGKHKTGASCLYVNTLADIDMDVLEDLVRKSVAHMRKTYC